MVEEDNLLEVASHKVTLSQDRLFYGVLVEDEVASGLVVW
jgi:hypothetical protein